jgi:hypothetical protein
MAHGAWSIEFKNKKAPIPSCGSQSAERIAIKHLETKSSNPLVVRIAHSAESIAKIKRKKEPHPSYPRDGAQSTCRPVILRASWGGAPRYPLTYTLVLLTVKDTVA